MDFRRRPQPHRRSQLQSLLGAALQRPPSFGHRQQRQSFVCDRWATFPPGGHPSLLHNQKERCVFFPTHFFMASDLNFLVAENEFRLIFDAPPPSPLEANLKKDKANKNRRSRSIAFRAPTPELKAVWQNLIQRQMWASTLFYIFSHS